MLLGWNWCVTKMSRGRLFESSVTEGLKILKYLYMILHVFGHEFVLLFNALKYLYKTCYTLHTLKTFVKCHTSSGTCTKHNKGYLTFLGPAKYKSKVLSKLQKTSRFKVLLNKPDFDDLSESLDQLHHQNGYVGGGTSYNTLNLFVWFG